MLVFLRPWGVTFLFGDNPPPLGGVAVAAAAAAAADAAAVVDLAGPA